MRNTLTIIGLGRTVRGTPTPSSPVGLFVKRDGLQGFEGLPAGRRESLARALSHGEHDVPVRLPARTMTVDGWIIAHDLDELRKFAMRVRGWGATGERFPLLFDHQRLMLTATVRRISAEAPDTGVRWHRFLRAAFQVQFLAADPRWYGETVNTLPRAGLATAIEVEHDGNFPAHPVIEIPDAPSSYAISSPGGTFSVNGATPGGLHRIDLRNGRVTRDGVWMESVGRGQTWAVPDEKRWPHTLSAPGRVLIQNTYV
ncbi:phage tail domain-containing protein [Microbacterium sp. IEGM 1404]|uniref:phage tail domain-containing protein n=1 Tax=Microbacterium sp. IEGM 1404 TaxID=3047084 RepID=UPI0024B7E49C|nr:phage tail domain-containing protein [Microbacterium sp. IEGM 1404]MDI9889978.1 phage tail family protein [Microbacterium sp. IEGM 1404]